MEHPKHQRVPVVLFEMYVPTCRIQRASVLDRKAVFYCKFLCSCMLIIVMWHINMEQTMDTCTRYINKKFMFKSIYILEF